MRLTGHSGGACVPASSAALCTAAQRCGEARYRALQKGAWALALMTLVVIAAGGCASVKPLKPHGQFASLRRMAAAYGYTLEEPASGAHATTMTKGGKRVVFTGGSDVVLVNGVAVKLPAMCIVVGDDLMIPTSAIDIIEGRLSLAVTPPEEEPAPTPIPVRKVVIDPGHGGKYPGAVSPGGLQEKNVVLDIALRLRDILVKEGIEVVMTRSSDTHLSTNYDTDLSKRIDITTAAAPDLFLSIHADASTNRQMNGFGLFVSRDEDRPARVLQLMQCFEGSYASRKAAAEKRYDSNRRLSYSLAREIRKAFNAKLATQDRGIKEHGARVLKWAPCPAVLVEVEFITNPGGAARLASSSFRQKVAEALAEAILEFGRVSLARAQEPR